MSVPLLRALSSDLRLARPLAGRSRAGYSRAGYSRAGHSPAGHSPAGHSRAGRLAGWLAAALALALLGIGSVAYAQTRVQVQVRGGDATVTLTSEDGGRTYRCRTRAGRCAMEGVETGPYIATAEPAGEGRSPAPRRVMVAGSGGEVTVHLRLR